MDLGIGLHIPNKEDFDRYDIAPADGVLYFDEWKSVHDSKSAKLN